MCYWKNGINNFILKNIYEKIFEFWEKIKGFDVRVLNEREVRAGAVILFFFALIAFMNAWLTGNFYITKVFVIAFLIFFISQLNTLRNIEQDVIQNLPIEEVSKWKDDCIVPDWAKSIWHEEKWKLHNNCE